MFDVSHLDSRLECHGDTLHPNGEEYPRIFATVVNGAEYVGCILYCVNHY